MMKVIEKQLLSVLFIYWMSSNRWSLRVTVNIKKQTLGYSLKIDFCVKL